MMGKKKRRYTPEQRAAVLAALLEGQAVTKVADDLKIPRSTVQGWRQQQRDGKISNGLAVGDLLLEYLTTNLDTLKKQAVFFSDRDWLAKQSASELAVLHGVMSDKAIRILEAYGAQEESKK